MAILLNVCKIFSGTTEGKNRHFRHCVVIVDHQRRNALRYQRNLYIAEKYILWATILSLIVDCGLMGLYLHSFRLVKFRDSRFNIFAWEWNMFQNLSCGVP